MIQERRKQYQSKGKKPLGILVIKAGMIDKETKKRIHEAFTQGMDANQGFNIITVADEIDKKYYL